MDTWVPLATLHCQGPAQTWWRTLRTPAHFIHWTQFCSIISNRFSSHSAHGSPENFHQLKETSSVAEYIQQFEEMMSLMQMDHSGLFEPYVVNGFITGLKEGIKHYLVPHNSRTLSDTYWNAKELEKGIFDQEVLVDILHLCY
jgi:hypothetical protein